MASSNMKKFLALYLVPVSVIDEWAKTDPEKRKVAEEKMQGEWGTWMGAPLKNDHQHGRWREDQTGHVNLVFQTPGTISCCTRS
jgi:hypothetical protein